MSYDYYYDTRIYRINFSTIHWTRYATGEKTGENIVPMFVLNDIRNSFNVTH